mmetsp:Transcript_113229/g.314886  ORF Transcript_113229/g.314886 Transcript_113229/m.314886 type:complete len:239 (-) Transcript_113229:42-758(-)
MERHREDGDLRRRVLLAGVLGVRRVLLRGLLPVGGQKLRLRVLQELHGQGGRPRRGGRRVREGQRQGVPAGAVGAGRLEPVGAPGERVALQRPARPRDRPEGRLLRLRAAAEGVRGAPRGLRGVGAGPRPLLRRPALRHRLHDLRALRHLRVVQAARHELCEECAAGGGDAGGAVADGRLRALRGRGPQPPGLQQAAELLRRPRAASAAPAWMGGGPVAREAAEGTDRKRRAGPRHSV